MILEAENISKFYGKHLAVDHISFSLKKGEVTGFLGVNGAGKSTTMKMLTGAILPDTGYIRIKGEYLNASKSVKKNIGYLSEHNPLYPEMYVREYLGFMAQMYKVPFKKVDEVIQRVGLDTQAHKKIRMLSKGYRQRVGLGSAILHRPEILILDEPTTGLDPNQIVEIRNLIKQLSRDTTVLLSSHIMQEVQALCDRVIILHQGKIILDERLVSLLQDSQIVEVAFDYRVEERLLRAIPKVISVENKYDFLYEVKFDTQEDCRSLLFDFALQNGLKILQINHKHQNLEQMFHSLTQ